MQVSLIDIGNVTDKRGSLSFIDIQKKLPFEIKNIFFIDNVPAKQSRANHLNKKSIELLIPIKGSFKATLNKKEEFNLDNKLQGLLIPNNNWIELFDFSEDAICLVLGSEPYSQEEKTTSL